MQYCNVHMYVYIHIYIYTLYIVYKRIYINVDAQASLYLIHLIGFVGVN